LLTLCSVLFSEAMAVGTGGAFQENALAAATSCAPCYRAGSEKRTVRSHSLPVKIPSRVAVPEVEKGSLLG